MKKLLAIAVLFTVLAASESFAQPANATATVSLTVNNALSLATNRNMAFGVVVQGVTTATINPITGGATAAMFTLGASATTPVTVTFSSTDLQSGVNTISFAGAGTLSGNSTNVQASSTNVTSGSTVTTSGTGAYFFWAGGTATLLATQPTGAYSGSFTISVTY